MSKANTITDQETFKPDVETVRLKFALPSKLYRQLQLVDGVDSDPMSAIVEQALAYVLGNADDVEASDSQNQRIYTCEDYDKLLESNPNDYKAWYGRGVVLKNIGRYEEAIASLDKALEIKLDYYKAWYARGNALYGLDFYEEAIASYEKAIEFKPDYAEALYYRDKALDELGCHQEAKNSLKKAQALKQNNHKVSYISDRARSGLGRFQERNLTMAREAQELAQYWLKRLAVERPEQSEASSESIIRWLLGSDSERFETLIPKDLEIAKQAMEYRYRILIQRYLGSGRERAYRNLITRLGSVVTLRNKIQTWVSLSRDRQRSVLDVLQEVLQELLQGDSYIQQQMVCIAEFTTDPRLQSALLFASVEEYCLRPVRNQPLLVYRFVNYLRRTQRGGLTQVPTSDKVRLVSEEIFTDDSDNRVNLLDSHVITEYLEAQEQSEQEALRQAVVREFENYLLENLGPEAVQWLRLYLQGKSQDEIAKKLNKPIKEVYRLREKISYHAVRVFAIKGKPELVDNWLSISLQENNLGLTQTQFGLLSGKLTALQRQILELRRAGNSIEAAAQQLKLKTHQVTGEWTKIYLVAQALRSQE